MALSKNRGLLHAIIERDAEDIQFGTIAYTIYVDKNGEPDLTKLKVSKNRRRKYVNK